MSLAETPIANLPGSSSTRTSGAVPLDVSIVDDAGNQLSRFTPFSFIATGGANQDSQVIKASAGTLGFLALGNTTASIRFVKFYDKATGPTSSDTPVLRFVVPGSSAGGGSNVPIPVGAVFANGISFRITTGVADNDANAATANDVIVNAGTV